MSVKLGAKDNTREQERQSRLAVEQLISSVFMNTQAKRPSSPFSLNSRADSARQQAKASGKTNEVATQPGANPKVNGQTIGDQQSVQSAQATSSKSVCLCERVVTSADWVLQGQES